MAKQFGVASSAGSLGYIQTFEITKTTEVGEARDENGAVAQVDDYNPTAELSFEYIFEGTEPVVGATLTAETIKYMVISITTSENNQDYKRLRGTCRQWTTNTLPAS